MKSRMMTFGQSFQEQLQPTRKDQNLSILVRAQFVLRLKT